MKKNIAMRVAAFLFILTMISTCAFATTFAKYTTSKSATDTARVAKWGVEVEVESTAFTQWYKNEAVESTDTTLTVAGSEKVVAPGTEGTLFTLSIKGTPEVDTKVIIDFSMTLTGWTVNSTEYCPLVFTVNSGSEIKNVTSVDSLIAELEKAIEGTSNQTTIDGKTVGVYNYDANVSPAHSITVTWAWAFEGNDDAKDTALGTAAANGSAPTILFNIGCTVEQVD